MKKKNILLVGHMSYDPLGRHIISFINTLLKDDNNQIYIDKGYLYTTENKNDTKMILNTVYKEAIRNGKIKYDTENSYNFYYDFVIFTDSISTEKFYSWEECVTNRNANIKICYPVYDGSMPPLHWIDIINNNFDICVTPSEYCANNLKRFGVKIDCFGLGCAILIDDFLKINPKPQHKTFRFGSIGASDFRKNLPLLIEDFANVFTKNDDVELYIHSSYGKDITCDKEIEETYYKYKDKANIILQTKKIPQVEMNDLWASFNAYISPQTTTGYFTTPAEAMAIGIPCILSDIETHRELVDFVPENNNLFFVKHDKPTLAYHWAFNYRSLGCKLETNKNSYCEIIKYVYEHRNEFNNETLVKERKVCASKLTARHLSKRFNLLVGNGNFAISNNSTIDNDTFFMSEDLAKKYIKYNYGKFIKKENKNVPKRYTELENPEFKLLEKISENEYKIYIKNENIFPPVETPDIRQEVWYFLNFIPFMTIYYRSRSTSYKLFGFITILKKRIR